MGVEGLVFDPSSVYTFPSGTVRVSSFGVCGHGFDPISDYIIPNGTVLECPPLGVGGQGFDPSSDRSTALSIRLWSVWSWV